MSRARYFTPAAKVARPEHVREAQPSTIRWSTNPADSIAVFRPARCTVPRCTEPPMIWRRCRRCRQPIARCYQHEAPDPIATAHATHEAACPAR